MPTNNDETPTKKTLREKTQSFRNKALRILRMERINGILQTIFQVNKEKDRTTKELEDLTKEETFTEKMTARAEYQMSKLDENDPDYEDKKVKATTFVETEKERQVMRLKQINSAIDNYKETIEKYTIRIEDLDKEIEAVESGNTKMSINEMNDLTQELIAKS